MQETAVPTSPYEHIGGAVAVRQLVDRFYDLMEERPEARRLRDMHAQDLGPMRQKLFEFLSGWLGGPPLYFQRADAKCMGAAHRELNIDAELGEQWMLCMSRALNDVPMPDEWRNQVERALRKMTEALRTR